MSRYCPHDIAPVLAAAKRWQDRCLLDDLSIFSENPLWTGHSIVELRRLLADPLPETGNEQNFPAQLQLRLGDAPPACQQLAAEMTWLLLLFPHSKSLRGDVKADLTATVWEWSGSLLPPGNPMLLKPLEHGVGHPGPFTNADRWQQLQLLTRVAEEFKREDQPDRLRLCGDPWIFGNWVDSVTESASSPFPHIIKFLLFPDFYERIAAREDKLRIITAFSSNAENLWESQSTTVDRALYDIRLRLEEEHDTQELDFYRPPLRARWISVNAPAAPRQKRAPAVLDDGRPRFWMEKTPYRDLAFRRNGEWSVGRALISPRYGLAGRDVYQNMREVRTGDRVLHFVDGHAITGISKVREKAQNHPEGLPETDLADRPAYKIGLEEFCPVTPPITRDEIMELPLPGPLLRRLTEFDSVLAHSRHLEGHEEAYLTAVPEEFIDHLWEHFRDQVERSLPHLEIPREPPALPSPPPEVVETVAHSHPFDSLVEDLFIDLAAFCDLVDLLKLKKNLILQGPPGVGKTYLSRRLALAVTGCTDGGQVERVHFHPAYTYETLLGSTHERPDTATARDGVFVEFCKRAAANPEKSYVFIFDDLDLAGLRRVFGELTSLIEPDKRSADWAVTMARREQGDTPFFVPENVMLLGLMNTATRTPGELDFSLRRRFAFAEIQPAFETAQFKRYLRTHGTDESVVEQIVGKMAALNQRIAKKTGDLGAGFRIGHSFFCHFPRGSTPDRHWYLRTIRYEIAPLVREYWVSDPAQAELLIEDLLKMG